MVLNQTTRDLNNLSLIMRNKFRKMLKKTNLKGRRQTYIVAFVIVMNTQDKNVLRRWNPQKLQQRSMTFSLILLQQHLQDKHFLPLVIHLITSSYSLNVSSSSSSHEWFIDSGASYHMIKDTPMLLALKDCNANNIYFGDNRSLNIQGLEFFIQTTVGSMMSYVFLLYHVIFFQCMRSLIQVKVKP